MTVKTNTFYKPSGKPEIDRKRRMAQMLMQQGQQPQSTEVVSGYAVKQSPLAGLARALSTGLGGVQEGQAAGMEQQKADAARQAMADALSGYNRSQQGGQTQLQNGEAINWDVTAPDKAGAMFANALMQNEDTAPLGMQAQMGQMQAKQSIANELEAYKQKFPMELELARQRAAIEAQYGAAPAAVQIADEIQKARASGDMQRVNDLLLTGKMLEKGMQLGANGVETMGGFTGATTDISQAKQTGQNISDLAYKPQIAGASENAQLQQQLAMQPQIEAAKTTAGAEATQNRADTQAMPILEDMLKNNADTFDLPYLTALQGPAKVAGNEKQTTAFDLMKQNRLNLAAPLAKALGVNPTDKDFQATLERIVDVSATKQSREAQIRNLQAQIQRRQQGNKPSGKIRVSNGSEVLEIDPADLGEAQAEGFKPL